MKKTKKNKCLSSTNKKIKKRIGTKNFNTLKKIILFGLGGVLLLSIKILLTYLLVDQLKININIAYLITIIIAIIIGFLYSYYVTFKNKTQIYKKLIKYVLSVGIFYAADYFLVILATNIIGLYHLLSIVLVTAIIFLLKFITYDNIIFKEKS